MSQNAQGPAAIPFTKKLFVGLLLVNLLVLAFAAWTLAQSRDQYEAKANVAVQNLSLVLERSLAASIDKIDLALRAAQLEMERQSRSGGIQTTSINTYFAQLGSQLPEVVALRATDAAGEVIWGVAPGSRFYAGDRDYFKTLRSDPRAGMVISAPVLGRVTGKWMIFLARRYHDAKGDFAGTVLAGMEVDYFSRLFGTLDIGAHGLVALRNLEHALVARVPMLDDPSRAIGNKVVSDTYRGLTQRQPLSGNFAAVNASDGREKLFFYRRVTGYPLIVTVALAREDYLHEFQSDVGKTGVLVLLFMAVSCVFGALLLRAWRRQQALAGVLEQRVLERTAALAEVNDVLKRQGQQLVQAEKLAALGSLVAGVAHELNTPIGNMRLSASSLASRVQEFSQATENNGLRKSQLREFMEYCVTAASLIERSALRSSELIQSFKQVAVDQTSLRRRSFDLRETLDQTVVALTPLLTHTPYTVTLDVPERLEIDGYPGPLEQVITNLITNALAHAFDGRPHGNMHMRAHRNGDAIVLEFADDGRGIPDDIAPRVFEPFFTTHLGQGGSGLGLYTVYNIVTGILGGSIHLEGRPGLGARFIMRLPLVAPVAPAHSGTEDAQV